MLDLQTKIGLNAVFSFDFLNRVHQDGDPLILGVGFGQVELVDGRIEQMVLNLRCIVAAERVVTLTYPRVPKISDHHSRLWDGLRQKASVVWLPQTASKALTLI